MPQSISLHCASRTDHKPTTLRRQRLCTQHAPSYYTGIKGDSCGRAMMQGAILGASFGLHPDASVPADWLARAAQHQIIVAALGRLA